MIFSGVGLVRSRGKKLANFVDGKFETKDEKTILKLKMLGFTEFVEGVVKPESVNVKTAKKPTAKKKKAVKKTKGIY